MPSKLQVSVAENLFNTAITGQAESTLEEANRFKAKRIGESLVTGN